MLFAGLQDKQPSMVIPPMDMPLCSPAVVPIDKYLFAFPATDTVVKLPLEYYDMLLCTTQSANLLLLPSSVTSEPTQATICSGESYTWNGKTYTKPGSYTDTLTNIYGCDSIVTLHLEVLPDPPLTFTVNGVSFKMMRVRAGTFIMGATPEQGADAQANEKPAHEVTLTRDYFVSETVLTQELWTAVMGTTIQEEEAKGTGEKNLGYGPNYPMYCLSHNDCLLFVERLNQLTGLTFRMPTEAEWEYAARGGHLSRGYKYPGSNDPLEVAWSIENDPQKKLHPVKLLKPNELGLYDMAGNVWEYIYDFRRTYTAELQVNPMGNISGNQANIRGGSTAWNTGYNRVSCRHIPTGISKDKKDGRRAFRFVLDADRVIGEDNTTYQAYDTICAGDTYIWNGKTYTKPGSYTDTLSNIHGCDSIVTLHLHVLPDFPKTFTVNGVSFKMMRVRVGTFMMGATDKDTEAEADEFPRHEVTLTKDYFIAETEMTQALWQAIMGNNPSANPSNPQLPVNNITFDDCQMMIAKLNELTGLTFRLPTEAEWEYAARGGQYSKGYKYAGSDNIDEVAWYNLPDYKPVAQLKPNELGIYDMSGSVYEWCQDLYNDKAYTSTPRIDPIQSASSTNMRCLRGGSNKDPQQYSRIANRGYRADTDKGIHYGLRLVLDADHVITRDTICAGDTYTWNGNTYTKPGTYTDTLQNIYGCDSIVTLNLTVLPDPPITFTVNGVSFKMMRVRAGTFMMGATDDDPDAEADEFPRHEVTLTKDYFIGETEMTQALWQAIMGNNPSEDKSNPRSPVNNVSWDDCQGMIAKLNALTGLTFRLPTEAEWEYAARAGYYSRGYIYAGSNDIDEVAWYNQPYYASVASLKPNEIGVYDMSGSVYEWCQDWYDPNSYASPDYRIDPFQATNKDGQKCLRGGSNKPEQGVNAKKYSRLANRGHSGTETKLSHWGLRLALEATGIMENNREFVTYDTICAGDTYTWEGDTYTESGAYTKTLQNIYGCDSIVTLHLQVNPTYETQETVVACNSYVFNPFGKIGGGITLYQSGIYSDTTASITGCDSIVTLHLTINQSEVGTTEYVTICYGESYTWNGNTYNTSDTYTVTLTNALGCDSTATLVLTILPAAVTETETVVIGSDALPYIWRGQSLTATGQYTATEPYTTAACDSVIHVLDLTVLSTGATDEQTVTICDTELPYTWYNQDYTATGIYTYIEKYVGTDIDSIQHILHLTVNPTIRTEETITACDSYTWNGQTYTESGNYTYTTTAANGCDSITTLHLTINKTIYAEETVTACDSYTWNAQTYTESGNYTYTTTAANGCDSITTLHLTINKTVYAEETITACDSYEWNGQTYTTSGDYPYTTTAANSCDSIVTLHLTINQSEVGTTEYITICHGESYTWNGNTYDTSDTYTVTLTNTLGCDSTATLVLTIMPEAVTETENVTIGSDELPYIWRGQSLNATGLYTDIEQYMAVACDSAIHALNLTVLTTGATDEQTVTICDTELPYQWYNQDYTATGIYTHIEKYAGTDIDSIQHILHLTVNSTIRTEETIAACDSYTWNGQTYTQTGAYTYTTNAANGCDSITTLHLTINKTVYAEETITACDSYEWNGQTYTTSGDYPYTTTAANGCDSIVTLHLTINQSEVGTTEYATICYGESYTWNGNTYNTSDTYTVTLTNALGCDSTATLVLTIMPAAVTETESVTIGSNELPCTWRGQSLTATGQYTAAEPYTTAACDSVIHVLDLTVLSTGATDEQTVTICDTELPYQWYNQDYTATGRYTYSEQYAGTDIDSIQHVLLLTVNSSVEVQYSITACDHYTWSNGMTYTESGIYYDSLLTIHGCDSVEILTLTINSGIEVPYTVTACDSYTWSNGMTYTESGIYYDSLLTIHGCDSVEILTLTIHNGIEVPYTVTACDHYTWSNGMTYTASGIYYDSLQTIHGCDSVEILILTINYRDTAFFSQTACETYTWYGTEYQESGTYYYHTQTALGCDSVEVLYLTILPPTAYIVADTLLCYGATCDWRGLQLTTAGSYNDTVKNQLDCDSIIYTLHIDYLPDVQHLITDTFLCYGEVCDWRGMVYERSGTYLDDVKNVLGCDSIIYTLNLVIYPEIPITHVIDTMAGPEYHWNEQIYTHGGDYSVTLPAITGCDSVVNLHLVDNPAAIDTVLVYEQCAGTGEQEVEILTQGFIEQIVLNYAPQSQEASLRDTVMPYTASNTYTIQYDSVRAGVHEVTAVALFHGVEVATYTFALNYLYPNNIFEQRYNDLIAILTHDYNGGYDFAAFQWYKDGVLLPGETHSYLNQPLSFESEYSVLLTNTEGLQLMSCSFTPESKSDLSVYPTFVKEGSPVICRTTEPLQLSVYHVSGVLLYEQDLSVGRNEIYLPAVSGVYMLLFKAENHIERNMKVIVQ